MPVARTKIIAVHLAPRCAATLFAAIQVLTAGSADTLRGTQKEFEAIIAVVIGGTLLTGGYGSAIGAMFGAFIFGLVQMGIFYTGVDTDWFKLFMGAMMVIAVLFNSYVLRRATREPLMPPPLIELRDVDKYFGKVIALRDVSFDVEAGRGPLPARRQRRRQVDAHQDPVRRVSRRAAAKSWSTASAVVFRSPKDALDLGIATVYQDLSLVPLMSVARNFFLGREPREGLCAVPHARPRAHEPARPLSALADMGIQAARRRAAGRHAVGRRAPMRGDRPRRVLRRPVLILDEPTSALGVHQASVVLKLVAEARARGIGVVFISHNVHHAYVVGDRFTLLNRGRAIGTYASRGQISRDELLALMAGGKELIDLEQEIARLGAARQATG